jgi:hypothetical protein
MYSRPCEDAILAFAYKNREETMQTSLNTLVEQVAKKKKKAKLSL